MDQNERKLTEALRTNTEQAARQKVAVWENICRDIDNGGKRLKRKGVRWMPALATLLVLMAVFAVTPAGKVLADRIWRMFEPEKQVTFEVEGEKETETATLTDNTREPMGYVIYIDMERYVKQSANGLDIIKAKNFPKGYPPVEMEISQRKDQSSQTVYASLLQEAEKEYDKVQGKGEVTTPVKGLWIHALDNGGGEAALCNIYVVDNTKGGCFVITCKLFVEAEEGHGARFTSMLKTFEVVTSDQVKTK